MAPESFAIQELQGAAPRAAEAVAKVDRSAQRVASESVSGAEASPATSLMPAVKEAQKGASAHLEQESLSERQKDALKEGFRDLNKVMESFAKSIRFAVFDQSGDLYAQVINTHTEEVVKTIPSEEALEMMARIHEVIGMLVDAEG